MICQDREGYCIATTAHVKDESRPIKTPFVWHLFAVDCSDSTRAGGRAGEFLVRIEELEAEGMQGFILDLRFNSGGYFDSAVEIADKFLEEGLIVITRPRFGIPTYSAALIGPSARMLPSP